ncbi:glycosyltransferase family 25 protein [Providencia rettgeri]
MNKIAIYVVSLANSNRRQLISEQFDKIGIKFSFIDAVNGKDIVENEVDAINASEFVKKRYKRVLGRNEIGCSLSHQLIYKQIAYDDIDYAFIFEDDVTLSHELVPIIKFFTHLQSNVYNENLYILGGQQGLSSQDMIVLDKKNTINISDSINFYKTISSENYIFRTCCYIISRNVALRLLTIHENSFYLADDWSLLYKEKSFEHIYLSDYIKHPVDLSTSTIQQERHKKATLIEKIKKSKLRKIKIILRQLLLR